MEEHLILLFTYLLYTLSGIQIFFLVIVFGRMLFFQKNKNTPSNSKEGISVVIAARNEYLRLKQYLPSILEQKYPLYEVIVVNDSSTDETEFLLKELQTKYPHLSYLNVQGDANFFKGKKFPLSMGIKSAHYDTVLLTDADCKPAGSNWIQEMHANYQPDTEIVLGYGAYQERKGFLNKLIRYDTLRVAITYLSLAAWGMPYMGVGRNLSYRRNLFFSQKGFMSHYTISSGDDDLFVNKAANKKNTQIAISAEAKTLSIPKSSFSEWITQKKRHFTTGKKYKTLHLLVLGIWESSSLLFYITVALMLILKINTITCLSLLGLRIFFHLIITKKFMHCFEEQKLFLFSPILDLMIVVINPLISVSNLLYKQRKWK